MSMVVNGNMPDIKGYTNERLERIAVEGDTRLLLALKVRAYDKALEFIRAGDDVNTINIQGKVAISLAMQAVAYEVLLGHQYGKAISVLRSLLESLSYLDQSPYPTKLQFVDSVQTGNVTKDEIIDMIDNGTFNTEINYWENN